jgi:hypothetical protein
MAHSTALNNRLTAARSVCSVPSFSSCLAFSADVNNAKRATGSRDASSRGLGSKKTPEGIAQRRRHNEFSVYGA